MSDYGEIVVSNVVWLCFLLIVLSVVFVCIVTFSDGL